MFPCLAAGYAVYRGERHVELSCEGKQSYTSCAVKPANFSRLFFGEFGGMMILAYGEYIAPCPALLNAVANIIQGCSKEKMSRVYADRAIAVMTCFKIRIKAAVEKLVSTAVSHHATIALYVKRSIAILIRSERPVDTGKRIPRGIRIISRESSNQFLKVQEARSGSAMAAFYAAETGPASRRVVQAQRALKFLSACFANYWYGELRHLVALLRPRCSAPPRSERRGAFSILAEAA